MADLGGPEGLIRQLSERLPPVRRLWKPWARALVWLGVCAALSVAMLAVEGSGLLMLKLSRGPDEVVEFVGAVLTACCAGLAAFTLAVPGRPAVWALLPLPPLLLWLGGGGWGCWRFVAASPAPATLLHPPLACFRFIVLMSAPLSLLLFVMLRRSFSVRPTLTATLAGLAAAAAAAALLDLVHPFDVTLPDLAAHLTAVLAVVGLNWLLSGRALRRLSLAMAALAMSQAAAEPRRPVVLELFTSQGCSSCPPADALLGEYAHSRPDLLPLSFHVEYWNRLGWTDPYSAQAYTDRERLHAARLGEDTVYTPELVVDGARAVVGSDREEVARAIRAAQAEAATLATVSVRRSGPGEIAIAIGPGIGQADVLLIGFDAAHTTSVGRGENGGRTLHETNVVRSLQTVAHWGGAGFELRRPAPEGERVAIVLEAASGRVVGSAALP